MLRKTLTALFMVGVAVVVPSAADAQGLRGSKASMDRQNQQARAHDFTFLRDGNQVRTFANSGLLVRLPGNTNYALNAVSYPYARPEVKLFVERLSSQFRSACGEQLVVTSLTRPQSSQPRNASSRSVHPTGMALDIRRHNTPACRSWLERVLLSLEGSRVLEVSLEQRPPHYHIALFPDPYRKYVAALGNKPAAASEGTYTVARKDTLWRIARNHGTTTTAIQRANNLRGTTIYPGQKLLIPVDR